MQVHRPGKLQGEDLNPAVSYSKSLPQIAPMHLSTSHTVQVEELLVGCLGGNKSPVNPALI